jgi:muramoyltetrapeptide carboxypeptidase
VGVAAIAAAGVIRVPEKLSPGDKVRFVSPASPPDREAVVSRARILESWGLAVDFGRHVYAARGYLAGTDEQRLSDFDEALSDPSVRAIFATRGGKGSYRIADRLDFEAAKRDPKFVVGFSDITALHLSLLKHAGLVGLHGTLIDNDGLFSASNIQALKQALMEPAEIVLRARSEEPTARLTTCGSAVGPLVGGNLDMVATTAGWALPSLQNSILLLEAVNMAIGQVDRQMTMLGKSGRLNGIAGVVLGQFTGFRSEGAFTVFDVLREHLEPLGVPVLGGIPLGHGAEALCIPIGVPVVLDAGARELRTMKVF